MAEQSTFVKVDRNIMRWRWYKDANTIRVFLHLILKANIEDNDFEKITVHRGEVVTSIPSLSQQLKISVKSVRTALEHLKETGEVAARIYPHYQVITILEYDRYQAKQAGRSAGKRQAGGRQTAGKRHQSKKVRMEEGKEGKDMCAAHIPSLAEVADFFRDRGRSQEDAAKFHAYNSARGWKIGRTPIEDWHSAVDMWIAQGSDVSNAAENDELDDFGRPVRKEFK